MPIDGDHHRSGGPDPTQLCLTFTNTRLGAGGSVSTSTGAGAVIAPTMEITLGGHQDNLKLNLKISHCRSLIKRKSINDQ